MWLDGMSHKSFEILHGIGNYRPPEHWKFPLDVRTRERAHHVLCPQLPDPDTPLLEAWQHPLYDRIDPMQSGERVVTCH